MDRVASRFGQGVYYAVLETPIIGRVVVRLYTKLLDRIRIREDVSCIADAGHVDPAIKVIIHRTRSSIDSAVDERALFRIPKHDAVVVPLDPGYQVEQRVRVAVDDGKVDDLLRFDGSTDFRIGRIHQRDLGADLDGLTHLPQLKLRIHTRRLIRQQHDSRADDLLESAAGNIRVVTATGMKLEPVLTLGIGFGATGVSRSGIGDGHLRSRNRSSS